MKVATLALLAGVSVPLLATTPGRADLLGLEVTSKPNDFGLVVFNVYAVFDGLDDHMVAVAGTPLNPLSIHVIRGTLFQHPAGSDLAPNPYLFQFPGLESLRYDTFVTIGVKAFNPNDPGQGESAAANATVLTPLWPGFQPGGLEFTNAAWAVTPDDPQGDPFAGPPENQSAVPGQVLLGQFTVEPTFPVCSPGLEGTMFLQYFSGGIQVTSISFSTHVHFDCNGNGNFDCEDVADGTSPDCNGNFVPDECEVADGLDCNGNEIPDDCDVADGTSDDLNGNGLPDECECLADQNDTSTVDIMDFLIVLAQWGSCPPGCLGDIDRDGQVGILDLLYLLEHWGPCPSP